MWRASKGEGDDDDHHHLGDHHHLAPEQSVLCPCIHVRLRTQDVYVGGCRRGKSDRCIERASARARACERGRQRESETEQTEHVQEERERKREGERERDKGRRGGGVLGGLEGERGEDQSCFRGGGLEPAVQSADATPQSAACLCSSPCVCVCARACVRECLSVCMYVLCGHIRRWTQIAE